MGPILALGIVVMVAAGLTLLPAVLSVLGRRAFWPAIPVVEPERPHRRSAGRGSARSCAGGPALLAGVCVAILTARRARQPRRARLSDAERAVPDAAGVRPGPGVDRQALPAGARRAGGHRRQLDAALDVRRPGCAATRWSRTSNTDSQSRDGRWISLEALAEDRPVLAPRDGRDPGVARGGAGGAARPAASRQVLVGGITAEEHDNLAGAAARREADRAARAAADLPGPGDPAAGGHPAAVRDRDGRCCRSRSRSARRR